jgi:heme exporter protein D
MLLQQGLFLAAGGILWLCWLVTAFTIIVVVLSYIQELNKYMREVEIEEKRDLFNY